MDTSETYIKMRLAAIPDLGMGAPPNLPLGDDGPAWVDYCVFIDRHGNYYYSRINMRPIGEGVLSTTMLERQDQLQEMLEDCSNLPYSSHNFGLVLRFMCFLTGEDDVCTHEGVSEGRYTYQFTSMEQLWLAFVMNQKFGKVWNGEKWVSV
jgi:hypothetical protein